MFGKDAKVAQLRDVPLFSHCSKSELAEIAAAADELQFPPGRELITEGARGREFVVVLDGEVEVRRGGRRVPLKGGQFFGEAALLTGAPRNATVTTTSDVTALVLTDRAFKRLLERSPAIQGKLLASLAERVAEAG
jgi:CPA2 family monovalent cation:H+ antiporter-2